VEIERFARCRGRLAIIASIEEPAVIARILAHLKRTRPERYSAASLGELPVGARAPPRELVRR
jgi:hypothetical protein